MPMEARDLTPSGTDFQAAVLLVSTDWDLNQGPLHEQHALWHTRPSSLEPFNLLYHYILNCGGKVKYPEDTF